MSIMSQTLDCHLFVPPLQNESSNKVGKNVVERLPSLPD